ncbi:MAG: helical backbone metal receptor [Bryobacteraceae bacterium]
MHPYPALLLALSAVALAQSPSRIVSTAPSFTETMFALGAGNRVIAVSEFCHFPEQANRLPRVGSYLQPNIEAIAKLEPDLVLVHAEQKAAVAQLHALGLRTLALTNTSLEDTIATARRIGDAIGSPERGIELDKQIRSRLTAIEKRAAGKPRRSLLFVVGRTPGRLDGMIAVGKGSFLNELIRIAGGRNVLADSPVTYPKISLEGVLRLDPDVIVDMGDMAVTTGVTEAHTSAVVKLWKSQAGVRAAASSRVFAVASDIYVVPGPRVSEAAEAFHRMLFPEPNR